MLKVGVIGCGKIAQVRHIPEYAANERAQIVGFYDRTFDRAEEMAAKYGGKAYKSYTELLADPNIVAVSVCVSNYLHAEVTMQALRAGKHVLCEKPMATTMADCEAMVAEAEKQGRKLLIGHNQILAKAHQKAKELLEQGLIGELLTFRTTFGHGGPETWSIDPGPGTWFFDKDAAVMGSIGDLGVHKIYLIQYLTGQRITEATAKLATLNKKNLAGEPISLDDNAIALYKMANGVMGTMTSSWTYYGAEDNSTILYGTGGMLRIYEDPEHAIVVTLKDGERIYYDLESIQTNVQQSKSGVIDEFVAVILEDRDSELSGKKALASMRVVFASIESAQAGKTITISEHLD